MSTEKAYDDFKSLDLSDSFAIVSTAHHGIGIHYFDQLLETTGIQKGVLAALVGVDPRTIDNYRKHQKKFDML